MLEFFPMYLFSCAADISLFNKKTERKCSSTTTSWGYQMLLGCGEAMTAINIPDAGPQMTYRVSKVQISCEKSTAQYSKAHKSCWVFVGLASNPNVHVLYSKLAWQPCIHIMNKTGKILTRDANKSEYGGCHCRKDGCRPRVMNSRFITGGL